MTRGNEMSGTDEELISEFHKATKSVARDKVATPTDPPKPAMETADAKKRLRSIVDRIVRLEEEKKGLGTDIKEIYDEGKSAGYSKRAIRIVVKREMEDAEQCASREAVEQEAELMLAALGDFASSPLGEAAVGRKRH